MISLSQLGTNIQTFGRFWRIRRWIKNVLTFRVLRVHELKRTPVGANPFNYELTLMGTHLYRGWTVMHNGPDNPKEPLPLPYIELHNARTGKRFRIFLPQD